MLHSKWSSQKHVKFKVKSVLIAGTHSHISAFPVSAKTRRYSNFPKRVSAGMKCSKCLKSPERRDAVCCQHLQADGQKGEACLAATRHHTLPGCHICAQVWQSSFLGSAAVVGPLGTSELGQRQLDPQPLSPGWRVVS